MPIVDSVARDVITAMKEKDAARLGALRMMKTALKNQEIEAGKPLDDAAAVQVLMRMSKQRKESIEQFEKGGRTDLADRERAELKILEAYLPTTPDESEIRGAVQAAIAKTGATTPKEMGAVMKEVMATLAGRPVDGKQISALVRAALGG